MNHNSVEEYFSLSFHSHAALVAQVGVSIYFWHPSEQRGFQRGSAHATGNTSTLKAPLFGYLAPTRMNMLYMCWTIESTSSLAQSRSANSVLDY